MKYWIIYFVIMVVIVIGIQAFNVGDYVPAANAQTMLIMIVVLLKRYPDNDI